MAANLNPFEEELVDLICSACEVDDFPRESLTSKSPIIGGESPFGLDSLDALEVVNAVQKKYKVRIDSQNTAIQVLRSINHLSKFIQKNLPEG
ncbi:MAG: acyl carrier protein [Planctomycetes bacterium]|nr:acyl carrier protein [Planctomycetota bacterium]